MRNLALCGALGAIIMLIGDYLLFLTPWVNGADFNSTPAMFDMPTWRLIAGGAVGPVSALFYVIGALIFYVGMKANNRPLAFIISACFVLLYMLAGTFHCVYAAVGFTGAEDPALIRGQLLAMVEFMVNISTAALFIGTAGFIYLTLRHKTAFPKWAVLFTPLLWILLKPFFAKIIPFPLGSIIIGGWSNWVALGFFLLLASIWHRQRNA